MLGNTRNESMQLYRNYCRRVRAHIRPIALDLKARGARYCCGALLCGVVKRGCVREKSVGGGILSHIVSNAVPSALAGLTAGFGMMPGVPPRL